MDVTFCELKPFYGEKKYYFDCIIFVLHFVCVTHRASDPGSPSIRETFLCQENLQAGFKALTNFTLCSTSTAGSTVGSWQGGHGSMLGGP